MDAARPEVLDRIRPARATMTEDLANRLVAAIAVGAFAPGERLPPERELAETLGVSRATVRSALSRLADLGLVVSRRGRGGGTFVADDAAAHVEPSRVRRTIEVELARLEELFDYRCLVEGMIARAAAARRGEEQAVRMQEIVARFASIDAVPESMVQAREIDRQLHAAIVEATGNPHLRTLSTNLTIEVTLGVGSEPWRPHYMPVATAQHLELVERIVVGDVEGAGRAAERHFGMTRQAIEEWAELASVDGASPPV